MGSKAEYCYIPTLENSPRPCTSWCKPNMLCTSRTPAGLHLYSVCLSHLAVSDSLHSFLHDVIECLPHGLLITFCKCNLQPGLPVDCAVCWLLPWLLRGNVLVRRPWVLAQ